MLTKHKSANVNPPPTAPIPRIAFARKAPHSGPANFPVKLPSLLPRTTTKSPFRAAMLMQKLADTTSFADRSSVTAQYSRVGGAAYNA